MSDEDRRVILIDGRTQASLSLYHRGRDVQFQYPGRLIALLSYSEPLSKSHGPLFFVLISETKLPHRQKPQVTGECLGMCTSFALLKRHTGDSDTFKAEN